MKETDLLMILNLNFKSIKRLHTSCGGEDKPMKVAIESERDQQGELVRGLIR